MKTGIAPALVTRVLEECRRAGERGEVPVASMVAIEPDGLAQLTSEPERLRASGTLEIGGWCVLALEQNAIVQRNDPTAHAEVLAIQSATQLVESERLIGATLITALEPCTMCTGAIVLSRLARVFYFAPTLKGPGITGLLASARDGAAYNHYPEVAQLDEVRDEYAKLLRDFFQARRK